MFQIFTDSGANLEPEHIERYGLGVVPIHCFVDGEALDFSGGFDGHALYEDMRAGLRINTAMPSLGTFLDVFSEALERGEDVLYIGMSGGISGTFALSQSAAQELREEYPDRKIVTINTRGASLGEGLVALYAAELREQGLGFDEVAALAQERVDNMWNVFTVDDLSYLRRTGRLFSAAVKVTNTLNVKPILVGDMEGHIVLRRVCVGRRRSLDALAARYVKNCADHSAPVGLAHADCEAEVRYVADKLREAGCTGEITTVMYEPVTGSHVGPGTVALFFLGDGRP